LNPKSIGIEALVNLTYSGDRAGAYAPNLVCLCGYSTSYCPSGTLKELFERLGFDSNRTGYDKVIAVKKIFLGAKAAFEIFVNDGAKKIAEFVEKSVAVVLEQDKEDTKEFNELFGFPKKSRGVKITVTVENI
jgi:hypothetical protein